MSHNLKALAGILMLLPSSSFATDLKINFIGDPQALQAIASTNECFRTAIHNADLISKDQKVQQLAHAVVQNGQQLNANESLVVINYQLVGSDRISGVASYLTLGNDSQLRNTYAENNAFLNVVTELDSQFQSTGRNDLIALQHNQDALENPYRIETAYQHPCGLDVSAAINSLEQLKSQVKENIKTIQADNSAKAQSGADIVKAEDELKSF